MAMRYWLESLPGEKGGKSERTERLLLRRPALTHTRRKSLHFHLFDLTIHIAQSLNGLRNVMNLAMPS